MSSTMSEILGLVAAGVLRVDANGEIWRVAQRRGGVFLPLTPRRAESVGNKGYLRVAVQAPTGKVVAVAAHRVVWEVIRGPIPPGMQINHKDLNKQNNHPDNLEVVTGAGNIQHSYANGRRRPWSASTEWRGRPLVNTPENAALAAEMRARGVPLKDVAQHFGIGVSHAHRLAQQGDK